MKRDQTQPFSFPKKYCASKIAHHISAGTLEPLTKSPRSVQQEQCIKQQLVTGRASIIFTIPQSSAANKTSPLYNHNISIKYN